VGKPEAEGVDEEAAGVGEEEGEDKEFGGRVCRNLETGGRNRLGSGTPALWLRIRKGPPLAE
jgi:hypothetical protein